MAPAVFWWDGQAEKSVCKAGEFNPQSVVGIIGWRAHNVPPYERIGHTKRGDTLCGVWHPAEQGERIVNCAPKQHKAEKSMDRHRLFVIYLKNTK